METVDSTAGPTKEYSWNRTLHARHGFQALLRNTIGAKKLAYALTKSVATKQMSGGNCFAHVSFSSLATEGAKPAGRQTSNEPAASSPALTSFAKYWTRHPCKMENSGSQGTGHQVLVKSNAALLYSYVQQRSQDWTFAMLVKGIPMKY